MQHATLRQHAVVQGNSYSDAHIMLCSPDNMVCCSILASILPCLELFSTRHQDIERAGTAHLALHSASGRFC